ncbi:hypothetical protein [Paenibacillus hodogayensis]
MEQAKLLLHKPLTIKQIASSVGFNDPLYFSSAVQKKGTAFPLLNTARIATICYTIEMFSSSVSNDARL